GGGAEGGGVGGGGAGRTWGGARRAIVTTAEAFDVMLGVEIPPDELGVGATAREHDGATFEIWRPVDTFAGAAPTDRVYRLDREAGIVTFAPALDRRGATDTAAERGQAAVAAVPGAGRSVRLWYRTRRGPPRHRAPGRPPPP